ncbi:MAG TPA: hypothetical protein VHN15_09460, partial [Thermoanaerobaculia bacterium]|nr:hypothetical protein [Thermoanaerobaculia bacterium]
ERLQFERQGYFYRDPVDSGPGRLVFNRTVPLRDSWAQESQKQAAPKPAAAPPKPAEPKKAKEKEEKAPEPLTPEELEQLERMRAELTPAIQSVIAAHPREVERYRSGQTGILGFLMAQVMKQAQAGGNKPSPKLLNVLLAQELGAPQERAS